MFGEKKKSVQVASRKPELQNCKALVLRCFKFFLLYAGILMCQYSESVFVDRIVKCVLLSKNRIGRCSNYFFSLEFDFKLMTFI